MDYKIELLSVPVTDIDQAIRFHVDQVGFVQDHDHTVEDRDIRFVQLTPPGSACSILVDGCDLSGMAPGSQKGIQMVIDDADAARAQLVERGVDASEVDDQPWGRFVYFTDPDGQAWTLQQLPEWSAAKRAEQIGGT